MTLLVHWLRCDTWVMHAGFLHMHTARPGEVPEARRSGRASDFIDWRALRLANRACCCPAKPAVIVIMPPVPGRFHSTDLQLCGHHYRTSRQALAAAGAAIFSLDGTPLIADIWRLAASAEDPGPGPGTGTVTGGPRHGW